MNTQHTYTFLFNMDRNTLSFSLENFEGNLDVLIQLIQSKEIDITNIQIQKIIYQFCQLYRDKFGIDTSADFLSTTAFLLWTKSKRLLPTIHDTSSEENSEQHSLEFIRHLLEYQIFKEVASDLEEREEKGQKTFTRGKFAISPQEEESDLPPPIKIEIQELAQIFRDLLKQKPQKIKTRSIQEEPWKVSDKIRWLEEYFSNAELLPFATLFQPHHCKDEWVVSFLAILELMKRGFAYVAKQEEQLVICKTN